MLSFPPSLPLLISPFLSASGLCYTQPHDMLQVLKMSHHFSSWCCCPLQPLPGTMTAPGIVHLPFLVRSFLQAWCTHNRMLKWNCFIPDSSKAHDNGCYLLNWDYRPHIHTNRNTYLLYPLENLTRERLYIHFWKVKKNCYMVGLSLSDIHPAKYQNMTEKGCISIQHGACSGDSKRGTACDPVKQSSRRDQGCSAEKLEVLPDTQPGWVGKANLHFLLHNSWDVFSYTLECSCYAYRMVSLILGVYRPWCGASYFPLQLALCTMAKV